MIHAFLDNVIAGKVLNDIDASFEDGYRSQSAIDAIMKAGKSRQWEPVATSLVD